MVFTAPVTDLPYTSGDRITRLLSFVVPAAYDNLGWSRISLMVGVGLGCYVQGWHLPASWSADVVLVCTTNWGRQMLVHKSCVHSAKVRRI